VPALFPYERYQTLNEPFTLYYPADEETLARWIAQTLDKACQQLATFLHIEVPEFEILLVQMDDWSLVPHSGSEEIDAPHPYMTDVTDPPTLVIPVELDPILGEATPEKFAFMLYHELAVTFLEEDPRPWPENSPLWADEWQFNLLALWLLHSLDGVQGMANTDMREQFDDAFEPELDGKTPVTIRGFDWFEDTTAEDYLVFALLLEQFAADLLASYDIAALSTFLSLYRVEREEFLSDEVTALLGQSLGSGADEWLESLVYF